MYQIRYSTQGQCAVNLAAMPRPGPLKRLGRLRRQLDLERMLMLMLRRGPVLLSSILASLGLTLGEGLSLSLSLGMSVDGLVLHLLHGWHLHIVLLRWMLRMRRQVLVHLYLRHGQALASLRWYLSLSVTLLRHGLAGLRGHMLSLGHGVLRLHRLALLR